MTTPNIANSSIALSQINGELNFPTNTPRAINDMILRELTGVPAKTVQNTAISFSDLSNKTAFGGLFASASSNTSADFAPVSPTITLTTTTDLVDPVIQWSATVANGWAGIIVTNNNPKSITISLPLTNIGQISSNVNVGVTVSYAGHVIGTANQVVRLTSTMYDPALTFTGNTNVNVQGYTAQTATTTLTASANSTQNTTITFVVTPNNGATVSGNSVIFTVTAPSVTTDNTMIYKVVTNVNYKGQVIATNTQNVQVRAVYNGADFNFQVPATSNSVFANNGTVTSTLSVAASHSIPGANIAWTYALVSGANATSFTADPTNANATVSLVVPSGTFAMQKGIYNVTATLKYANGYVLNTKTTQLTLRAGAYGLTSVQAANIALSGYQAQTASSTSTFSWGAGSFALNYSLASGTQGLVSNSITGNSASFLVAEYANTQGTISAGVYNVNPVITFDGFVLSNTTFQQSVSASFLAYTFNVTGPTVNTQIGTGNVVSTILLSGSHTIPNGSISWTCSNPAISISSNTTAATLTLANTTLAVQSANVTATLLDPTGRSVATKTTAVTLRTYAPKVTWTGNTTVAVSGYAAIQTAVASIAASCGNPGANTFAVTNQKISGADLQIVDYTGNNSTDQITLSISTTSGAIGTQSGIYQLSAVVGFYDATYSVSQNVMVTATTLDPQFTLTANGQTVTAYAPPVTATGTATATFVVPNGKVNWSYTGGTPNSTTNTNVSFSYTNIEGNVGSSNITLSVTGTLVDSNGLFVAAKTVSIPTSATFIAPNPTLSGANTVTASNLYNASAATTLTASVAANVTGQTYQFSTALVSGPAPSTSIGANSITLTLASAGIQNQTSVIDVTCKVIIGGNAVSQTTSRVTLTANCPAPTMNYAQSPSSTSSYNYPVQAVGSASANINAPGYCTISWQLASGSSLSVANTNPPNFGAVSASGTANVGSSGSIYIGTQTSAIGTQSGTYTLTYRFYHPNGTLLNTTTGSVTVGATRRDPGFSFTYGGGPSSVSNSGWLSDGLQAIVAMQAYNNSDIPNVSYSFSPALTSGVPANFNYNNATGACNVQLIATDVNSKFSNYNVSCYLYSNGQLIGGPLTITAGVGVIPYVISYFGSFNDSEQDSPCLSFVSYTSNHPWWGPSNVTFTNADTGTPGPGATYRGPSYSQAQTSTSGTVVVTEYLHYNPMPPSKGNYGCSVNVTPNFMGHTGPTVNVTVHEITTVSVGTCVTEDMFMDETYLAREVIDGMTFPTWTPEEGFSVDFVKAVSGPHKAPVSRLESESGAILECTSNTKFNRKDAKIDLEDAILAEDMEGELALVTIYGVTRWEKIVKVTYVGEKNVMKIDFGGKSYAAGEVPEKMIFSHNLKQMPE